jgi:hypothetical protein
MKIESSTWSKFTIILFLFHTLRNFSILYIPALGFSYLVSIFSFFSYRKRFIKNLTSILYIFFLVYLIYIASVTLINVEHLKFQSIVRLFLAPLIPFIIVPLLDKNHKPIHLFLGVYFIGFLSVIFQIFFGEVSWLASSGERGGYERYSSTLGSLTIIGNTCGVAVLAAHFFVKNTTNKFLLIFCFTIMGILSLQKSAVINLLFAYGLIFFSVNTFKQFLLRSVFSFCLILIIYAALYINKDLLLIGYIDGILMNTFGITIFGTDVFQDDSITLFRILERVIFYAIEVYEYLKFEYVLLFGFGTVGGGGGMGAYGPQSHNMFWDLIFMGGIPFLFLFLVFFIVVIFGLVKSEIRNSRELIYLNFLFFVNCFVSSSFIFHPIGSFIFWYSVSVLIFSNVWNQKLKK